MKYDYNTNRTKGKVQINTQNWLTPDDTLIKLYKMNGKTPISYMTEATFIGNGVEGIQKGDYLLLSKVSCEVATSLTAYYTVDNKKYFDIPEEQILGVFKENKITFRNLELRDKNILFKKIYREQSSVIHLEDRDATIGGIIKVGKSSQFQIGDTVIVENNTTTPVIIDGEECYAVEEKFVVGLIPEEDFSIENMNIKNNYVLMKPYISKNVLNSKILETAGINYNNLDYSDINNRDLFKVLYADKSLKDIKKGDLLLLNRNYTNYVYYDGEKYFSINDKKWISGKIIERDK